MIAKIPEVQTTAFPVFSDIAYRRKIMLGLKRGKETGENKEPVVTSYLFSKVGERDNNEDSVGMYQEGQEYCFVLADGLGGHGKGELASRFAVEACIREFAVKGTGENCLDDSFIQAQNKILQEQKNDREAMDMKTTLVLLHIGENQVQWGHIGDSRLYYFENRKIIGRTMDHSVPQMLVAAGQIRESQIRHHPDRNRLLRVLGIDWDEPKYQLEDPMPRKASQQFLLCTDGFWELIDERKMQQTLKKADSAQGWIEAMEELILKNGRGTNMDNYSAVAVWIE